MAGLRFIDVAGLRLLVDAARALECRALRVLNLAPMLREVVGLVGWAETPGLILGDDEAVPA